MNPMMTGVVAEEEAPPSCDDLLALLAPPGESMDLDWLLDDSTSPGAQAAQEEPWGLKNVSAASRSLAEAASLCDQSSMSRSLATPHVKTEPQPLANMSAVSHNLANVGALPQCNQRHARCVAPVAVAEECPPTAVVAPPTLLDLSAGQPQPFRFSSGHHVVAAPPPKPEKPRGRRMQRAAATDDQQKKLEMRRTKNREAAERMRRRRREETAGLEKTVRELTARVDELSAKLAASEAENEQLRGLKQLVLAVAAQPVQEDQVDPASSKLLADQVARLVPVQEQQPPN